MKLKTRQRFLSLILTLCLLLSMTVQSVWATEEGGGTVTPQPASENTSGTLEFKDFSSVDVNTNTVTYANGADNYQLQVSYPSIGTNVIQQNEGHTELQNIPTNVDITFTLTTPASHTGDLPNLMIGDAREFFNENKIVIKHFNFSTNNHFMIRLDFPNNGGNDDPNNNNNGEGSGGGDPSSEGNNQNPPQPSETANMDVQVTYWVYEQLEEEDPDNPGRRKPVTDEHGNPVMGYVAFNPGVPNTLINGVKVNTHEPENQENPSGPLTFKLAGYSLDDTEHKNVFFFNTEFGAKINEAYLLKKDASNKLQRIEGTDFTEATGANGESTWTLEAAPQASYDIAIVPGISDDLTIIWTTDYDKAATLFKEAMKLTERDYGTDNMSYAVLCENLALCLKAAGSNEEAVSLQQTAMDIKKRIAI